eukprot:4899867-Alexandrium_andersonii.AAC.1
MSAWSGDQVGLRALPSWRPITGRSGSMGRLPNSGVRRPRVQLTEDARGPPCPPPPVGPRQCYTRMGGA